MRTGASLTRSSDAGASSAYALIDGLRHKYTVDSIASQIEGDEVQLPIYKYVPMIPEIYAPLLIPYAKAHGYASLGQTEQYLFWMGEYEKGRENAAIERASRAFPVQASFDHVPVIR